MAAPIVHIEFRSAAFGRTAAFYNKVLGWQTQQNASGTYMKLDGPDAPTAGWSRTELSQTAGSVAYVEVDDLAATLSAVEKEGGRVIVRKLAFAGGGDVAFFADPDGNVVGLWARKKGEKGSTPVAPAPAAGKAPAAAKPKAAKPGKAPAKAAKPAKKG
ncbi:MAG TPA: VOC family protein [Polyangia bacterium]|jgi:predicted enzyme related to lactoylglutathione lyase|nr:VOC family protein [Polyangia bacterium]